MKKVIQVMIILFFVLMGFSLQARFVKNKKRIEFVCEPKKSKECVEKKRQHLIKEMAQGFTRALRKEGQVWYECGVKTPKEDWEKRASVMAEHLLNGLDEFKLKINPWGVWGVIYNESRGNRCAIGPNPRKIAYKRKLIEQKNWRLWTEEEVLKVMNHRRMKNRPADLGIGQIVWKKLARIEENGKIRIPTIKEMLSVKEGTRIVAYSMRQRIKYKYNKKYKRMPWLFWPGRRPHLSYGHKVATTVSRMGGPWMKVLGHK